MTNFYQYDKPIRVDASTLVLFRANQDASNYSLGQKNIWTVSENATGKTIFKVFNDHIQYIFNQEGVYNVKVESFDKYGNLSVKQFDGFIKVKTIIPPPVNIIAPVIDVSLGIPDVHVSILFGYLYNGYAVEDSRYIANADWKVPTLTEMQTMLSFVNGPAKLSQPGTLYWQSGGQTNTSKLSIRGAGERFSSTGAYANTRLTCWLWTSTAYDVSRIYYRRILYGTIQDGFYTNKKYGATVRLMKISTTLIDGQEGSYKGNDGKIYKTICIGTQEWLAENLCETKYRNGDDIPTITDTTEWINLTTGAKCAYNNTESNAFS